MRPSVSRAGISLADVTLLLHLQQHTNYKPLTDETYESHFPEALGFHNSLRVSDYLDYVVPKVL